MRKLFYGLGALFLALIVAAGGAIGYAVYAGVRLDHEAKAYVDQAVPAIVADWSPDALRRRASPALLQATKPDDLRTMFAIFSKLGPLVDYDGSNGDANLSATIGRGETITARYVARARFKNGTATIDIGLQKIGGVWKVTSFRVNATEMPETAAGREI